MGPRCRKGPGRLPAAGRSQQGQVLCENTTGDPLKNPCKLLAPFASRNRPAGPHLDLQYLQRSRHPLPASDPSKLDTFKTGYSGSGLAVDSLGNVWIANRSGSSERGHAKLLEATVAAKISHEEMAKIIVGALAAQKPGYESGGSITVLNPTAARRASRRCPEKGS